MFPFGRDWATLGELQASVVQQKVRDINRSANLRNINRVSLRKISQLKLSVIYKILGQRKIANLQAKIALEGDQFREIEQYVFIS